MSPQWRDLGENTEQRRLSLAWQRSADPRIPLNLSQLTVFFVRRISITRQWLLGLLLDFPILARCP